MPLAVAQAEGLTIEDLAEFSADPEGFVWMAFPWGEPGTELHDSPGPDEWQLALLRRVGAGLSPDDAIREAVASGHGVGKSALVSWLILWAISTFEDTRGVVTANTQDQLRTKTWAELSKWFRLFIGKGFFKLTATRLCSVAPEHEDTWRVDAVTWSAENTEAFAGLHNRGKRTLVIMDEASIIIEKVWEVTEGAFTDADTERLWFAFGNPTQTGTKFHKCFGDPRWRTTQVDSRTVRITNKRELQGWADAYGADSDYFRVRVLGQFPRGSALEFIGLGLITTARSRAPQGGDDRIDPLILGVDVARQGEDPSVLFFRRGLDARSVPPVVVREPNLMTLAGIVSAKALELRVDAVFVDEGGIGAGLVDRLRQLRVDVHGIQFGAAADLPPREGEGLYLNKRSEMYGSARRWLATGLLWDDDAIAAELNAPMWSVNGQDKIVLEKKADIRKRLGRSTDIADAFVLTFAYPVAPKVRPLDSRGNVVPMIQTDYDPLATIDHW